MQRQKPKIAPRGKSKRAQTKVTAIFNAFSDDNSLDLFKLIAEAGPNGYTNVAINARIKLTRKQFYSKLFMLIKAGLIKRKKGRYFLTSLGKLVNDVQQRVQRAADLELRLKAIDSLVLSEPIPREERVKLIEELVGKSDRELADILLNNI